MFTLFNASAYFTSFFLIWISTLLLSLQKGSKLLWNRFSNKIINEIWHLLAIKAMNLLNYPISLQWRSHPYWGWHQSIVSWISSLISKQRDLFQPCPGPRRNGGPTLYFLFQSTSLRRLRGWLGCGRFFLTIKILDLFSNDLKTTHLLYRIVCCATDFEFCPNFVSCTVHHW